MIAERQIAFGRGAKKEESPAYWGLCFTAEEAGSTVAMQAVGSAPAVTLETSFDGDVWEPFIVGDTTVTLQSVGDKVYFRAGEGGNTAMCKGSSSYNNFVMAGRIAASGNIMSLLGSDATANKVVRFGFFGLFRECTSLTVAPELPVTNLFNANSCYSYMFYGCTSLTVAPELPATNLNLAINCYSYMFYGCTSLTVAPELPATKANNAAGRYSAMFMACKNLKWIKTAQSNFGVNSNWVIDVSPVGTFVCPTALGTNETISRGDSACPEGWTVINED